MPMHRALLASVFLHAARACRIQAPGNDCWEVSNAECELYYDINEDDGPRACAILDYDGPKCDGDTSVPYEACAQYTVGACVVSAIGDSCTPEPVDLSYLRSSVTTDCIQSVGQQGSVTYADLTLEPGSALLVQVSTSVGGLTADTGFFVRPTRITREWGKATIHSPTSASFYIGGTGQFSVEFVPPEFWRTEDVETFESLMLFVNPPATAIPDDAEVIAQPRNRDGSFIELDAGDYVFKNKGDGVDYDWGRDMVFKVNSGTNIYLEAGAHVRARIVQTEKKIDGVTITGYGTLDNHYYPEDEEIGVNDDRTRQTIVIFGKNIRVSGVTIIHTGPCASFGYCLNFNPVWAPLPDPDAPFEDQFDASELQTGPPYRFHQAHCQHVNMDDSPNTVGLANCPTSHADGNLAINIKCMTWQMGTDGVNPGKWGTVADSFVRVIDDALKAWDSHVVFENVVVWQLALGWPINLGWWQWNQEDVGGIVRDIYVIHNHNWLTSATDPEGPGGACTVGAEYGSGAPKRSYSIFNVFVETAASCAIGLHLNPRAFNRHTTPDGCVGDMTDFYVTMFFDEEFFAHTGGYQNYLSGDTREKKKCTRTDHTRGFIEDWTIAADVAGRPLAADEFYELDSNPTVSGVSFGEAVDPHPLPNYDRYAHMTFDDGEIDEGNGVTVASAEQCVARCHSDWSCDCVVFKRSNNKCAKRRRCEPSEFVSKNKHDVYVRPDAPSPPTCIDSSSWYYKKQKKDCGWIAKKTKRCKKSKIKDADGVKAKRGCPATCDEC